MNLISNIVEDKRILSLALVVGSISFLASYSILIFYQKIIVLRIENFAEWNIVFALTAFVLMLILIYFFGLPRRDGVPNLIKLLASSKNRDSFANASIKNFSQIVLVVIGAPFGMEGVIINTGGFWADKVSHFSCLDERSRKIIIGAGIASAFSTFYGTPFAGAFFALEIFFLEYEARNVLPIFLASAFSYSLRILFGNSAPLLLYEIPMPTMSLQVVLFFLGIAIAMGLGAYAVLYIIKTIQRVFSYLHQSARYMRALASILPFVFCIIFFSQMSIPVDKLFFQTMSSSELGRAVSFLILVKGMLWLIGVASYNFGSTIFPLIMIGAGLTQLISPSLGALFGVDMSAIASLVVLIGSTAFCASVIGALFSVALIMCEVTGNYWLVPFCILVCLLSIIVRRTFVERSFYRSLTYFN